MYYPFIRCVSVDTRLKKQILTSIEQFPVYTRSVKKVLRQIPSFLLGLRRSPPSTSLRSGRVIRGGPHASAKGQPAFVISSISVFAVRSAVAASAPSGNPRHVGVLGQPLISSGNLKMCAITRQLPLDKSHKGI